LNVFGGSTLFHEAACTSCVLSVKTGVDLKRTHTSALSDESRIIRGTEQAQSKPSHLVEKVKR
jgi:hypothetical protein